MDKTKKKKEIKNKYVWYRNRDTMESTNTATDWETKQIKGKQHRATKQCFLFDKPMIDVVFTIKEWFYWICAT